MTRTANARLAGFAFLFYIAVGLTGMAVSGRATGGEGMAAQVLPLQVGGLFVGWLGWLQWMPMLVFELWLSYWFLFKGVATSVLSTRPA